MKRRVTYTLNDSEIRQAIREFVEHSTNDKELVVEIDLRRDGGCDGDPFFFTSTVRTQEK